MNPIGGTASSACSFLVELASLPDRSTPGLRRWRQLQSRRFRGWSGRAVLQLAKQILSATAASDPAARFVVYELVVHHPKASALLTVRTVETLATGLASWAEVDMFGYCVAGPAWRRGSLSDDNIMAWTRSPNRWWRRAALVSTVPLNVRAQGGTGAPSRTLRVCQALVADREDMVVKALSWALRALVPRDPRAVSRFLIRNNKRLAARVLREVRCKLETGRKSPLRKRTAAKRQMKINRVSRPKVVALNRHRDFRSRN